MTQAATQADIPETWTIFCDRSPAGYGGGVPGFVGDLMEERGRFQTGLKRLTIDFAQQGRYPPYHADGAVITDGSWGERARWEDYFNQLPKRVFRRKARSLEFRLRGDPAMDYCENSYLTNVSRPYFYAAAKMIVRALTTLQATLKPSDGCDLREMIAAAEEVARREWPSDEALRDDLRVAWEKDRARIDAMDPWLKVDLSGAHPNARKLMDDPTDWSQSHEFAPHGNDLGADVLGGWSRFKGRSLKGVAKCFEIDLQAATEDASLYRIQLTLALAFAHLRKTGTCPKPLIAAARAVLARDREPATRMFGAEHQLGFAVALDRYEAILSRIERA